MSYLRSLDEIGSGGGQAVTDTLYVSPNGTGTDGRTWVTAYTTVQAALDAASTDADLITLIQISPHTTYYDIDTTGDPTWTGNYILIGSSRNFVKIQNDHTGATSIMKFTGKVAFKHLTIDCGTGTNNGVIISGSGSKGAKFEKVYFECEHVTGAQTALTMDTTEYCGLHNVLFHGVVANTKAILLSACKLNHFVDVKIHECATGIQITGATSDENEFTNVYFHECTLGLDIDAGNEQDFSSVDFHGCTTSVDDEVGDHNWTNITGQFDISVTPDNFTGVAVNTGDGADTWTVALQTIYTNAGSGPFRIVGVVLDVGTSEWYRLQLTADDGATYFDDIMFDAKKTAGTAAPSGTEHIFNKGTVIKGRSKSVSAGVDTLDVWLQIQGI